MKKKIKKEEKAEWVLVELNHQLNGLYTNRGRNLTVTVCTDGRVKYVKLMFEGDTKPAIQTLVEFERLTDKWEVFKRYEQ